MQVHFIVHENFEAPGAYEAWARMRGHNLSFTRIYLGDNLPASADDIDLLIVMGGPQSPDTTRDECAHFDSKAEQAFIAATIKAKKAVIGVCLGAQLTGEALNASYEHSPEKEIGKFPIYMTSSGAANPLFTHLGDAFDVGHWHNDMPGLTPEAQVIAYSEGCPRQIIAYSDRVYGFQCHLELTAEVVEMLIAHSQNVLSRAAEYRFIQTPEVLRRQDYRPMNQALYEFLDKLAAQIK